MKVVNLKDELCENQASYAFFKWLKPATLIACPSPFALAEPFHSNQASCWSCRHPRKHVSVLASRAR